jgi:hypothetical protein
MSSLSTHFQEDISPSNGSTKRLATFMPLERRTTDGEVFIPPESRPLESTLVVEGFSEQLIQLRTFPVKLEEFGSFTGPWLPPNVLRLLKKSKVQQLSEKEAVKLMDILAQRAIDHFQLPAGKFAAITFSGKIAELADTKLELLKRVQHGKYSEQVFLCKVGSNSFSGRI